jgi:hypothetical protein
MSQENLRAADTDRNRVVEELREHTAAGRLTMDEFEERMQVAMSARTFGDLAKLTTDLPALAAPAAQDGPVDLAAFIPPRAARGWPRPLRVWASISVFLIGIWLLTSIAGDHHNGDGFWPIFPIGVGALIVISRTIRGGGRYGRYGRPSMAERHARHLEMRDAHMAARAAHYQARMARRNARWGDRH